MITFKISFLLSFALHSRVTQSKKKGKTGEKATEKPRRKETKKKKPKPVEEEKESPVCQFGPEEILGAAHVDYYLGPCRIKYDLDVVCWKSVARIITRDGNSLVRTVIKKEKAWVPITMEHYIECLNTLEDLKKFRNHTIEFRVTHNVPKAVQQMKIMVRRDDLLHNDTFEKLQLIVHPDEVLMARPDFGSMEEYIRSLILRWANYPTHESVSWFNLPYRWEEFYEIIDKTAKGELVKCKEFVAPPAGQLEPQVKDDKVGGKSKKGKNEKTEKKSKKSDKKSKSSKSSKKSQKSVKPDTAKILVPGEIFFTDPDLVTYKSNTPTIALDDFFVMLSVKELMTRLLMEIYGIRTVHPKQSTCGLFGTRPKDSDISRIKLTTFSRNEDLEETTSTHVLLAVASYDLSSLLSNVWDFRERAQCHAPNLTLYQQGKGYYDTVVYQDMMTVPEIHFPSDPKKIRNLIEESVFLEHGTTLHLEAYILAPQMPCLVLHNQRNLFKRILMVINEEQLAKDIFVQIYSHNKRTLEEMKKQNVVNVEINEVLTGFLIDNGNNYLIFAEGLAKGFFIDVFHLLDKCNLKVIQ
nr:unnamed protein product [Callosobruchus chinensis]